MYSNYNRSARVRFILSSLLIVVVGLAILAAAPATAEAAYASQFDVNCKPDLVEIKVNAIGDYAGQPGYVRFFTYFLTNDNGWVHMATSNWFSLYMQQPGTFATSSTMSFPMPLDATLHIQMELATWNGYSWDYQRYTAAHYQAWANATMSQASHSCFI